MLYFSDNKSKFTNRKSSINKCRKIREKIHILRWFNERKLYLSPYFSFHSDLKTKQQQQNTTDFFFHISFLKRKLHWIIKTKHKKNDPGDTITMFGPSFILYVNSPLWKMPVPCQIFFNSFLFFIFRNLKIVINPFCSLCVINYTSQLSCA